MCAPEIRIEIESLSAGVDRAPIVVPQVMEPAHRGIDDERRRVELFRVLDFGQSFLGATARHLINRVPLASTGIVWVAVEAADELTFRRPRIPVMKKRR